MTTTHHTRTARLAPPLDEPAAITVDVRGAAERELPAPAPMPPSTRRPPTW